ncbi:hypothetical protein B9057_15140 (plasmid) [Aestuarium zhoushanense]|nr:hypothetical protein B9057_15140 [Aestuarium zhoushanense]
MNNSQHICYRKDVDGLRAIAFLSVFFYHLGFEFFGSGYSGVDVFFVISGYLIGGQIVNSVQSGSFSFREFYSRRFRRILPALYFVIISCMVVGYFWLLPYDYQYFFGAAFSAVIWLSNVWFMERIDYFNPEAANDPLVHTWSLGVEEQFYLFAPLLLIVVLRLGDRWLNKVLICLTLISFALAVIMFERFPQSSFYLLHTRAWELLLGIVASQVNWKIRSSTFSNIVQIFSLTLIVMGVLIVPGGVAWPGFWTLLPVLGTFGLLVCNHPNLSVPSVLSLKPVRWFGLISYSGYLWHQPIISFYEYKLGSLDTLFEQLVILSLTLVLAYFSYLAIENPFRDGRLSRRSSSRLLWAGSLAIFFCALGAHFTLGYPHRMPPGISEVLDMKYSYGPNHKRCLLVRDRVSGLDLDTSCVLGATVAPRYVLLGDSHANRLADGLGEILAQRNESLRVFTLSSCLPVQNMRVFEQRIGEKCVEYNDMVLDYLDAHDELEIAVMFAVWQNYFNADGGFAYDVDLGPSLTEDERLGAFRRNFVETVDRITSTGRKLIIISGVPVPGYDVPRTRALQMLRGDDLPSTDGFPYQDYLSASENSRAMFEMAADELANPERVVFLDPAEEFCDREVCHTIVKSDLLYSDNNHPSIFGVDLIMKQIMTNFH